MTQVNKNTPQFVAYHVSEGDSPFWTKIGAAWSHADKEGLSLQLDMIPASGEQIVLRKFKPKEQAA
jgi:hypothetical protein